MSHNRFFSEIFENLDVDYQMLISLGNNEAFYRPRNRVFSHVIGIYFISFFIEHPVFLDGSTQWFNSFHINSDTARQLAKFGKILTKPKTNFHTYLQSRPVR